jgi:hypothetical protein
MRSSTALFALVAIASFGACAGPQPVQLSNQWPAQAGDYEEVTARWTRSGRHSAAQDDGIVAQVIDISATFKSPEWRASHIRLLAKKHHLPDSEVASMTEKEKASSAEEYEVAILLATHDRRANDLHKGARSSWRLALVDDRGVEILPSAVVRDRRPRPVLHAEFPHINDFHQVYTAKFPRTVDLLRPDARRFQLKITGLQGGVVLTWSEK